MGCSSSCDCEKKLNYLLKSICNRHNATYLNSLDYCIISCEKWKYSIILNVINGKPKLTERYQGELPNQCFRLQGIILSHFYHGRSIY